MSKVTVTAPANIAFIKYWGARDLDRAIPCTPSISMTLRACCSRTTVAFEPNAPGEDEVRIRKSNGELKEPDAGFRDRARQHLDRLRDWAGRTGRFRMATQNSFPSAAGLASSASGFSALTLAAVRAMEQDASPAQLSVLARRSGSGSAARSVMGGYVRWPSNGEEGAAEQLAPADHWDLRDVIAIVETSPKKVPSREGHRRAPTSPFFETRLDHMDDRLEGVQSALMEREMSTLGRMVEEEAIELHLIAMSSRPPIFYWAPETLAVLSAIRTWREEGVAAYATMDAGANVHVICPASDEPRVAERLDRLSAVHEIIRDGVGTGPTFEPDHLF